MTRPTDRTRYAALPRLGHGVGLRREHWQSLFEQASRVDFVEILAENFMGASGADRRVLERAIATWPIVVHGTALSIGSVSPFDDAYLDQLFALIEETQSPWFSDHLCFSSVFGTEFHDLLPLPFTEEALEHVATRVQALQARAPVPFALENPSYYVEFADSEMDEATFLARLLEAADCGLLLDVNNVWVNSQNHGYDPRAFIEALPLERVVQIHMAGHTRMGEVIIDTHGARCIPPVLDLYRFTIERTGPVSTLVEWDNDVPPVDVLLAENDAVRAAAGEALACD